jgi:hypothetical protein
MAEEEMNEHTTKLDYSRTVGFQMHMLDCNLGDILSARRVFLES